MLPSISAHGGAGTRNADEISAFASRRRCAASSPSTRTPPPSWSPPASSAATWRSKASAGASLGGRFTRPLVAWASIASTTSPTGAEANPSCANSACQESLATAAATASHSCSCCADARAVNTPIAAMDGRIAFTTAPELLAASDRREDYPRLPPARRAAPASRALAPRRRATAVDRAAGRRLADADRGIAHGPRGAVGLPTVCVRSRCDGCRPGVPKRNVVRFDPHHPLQFRKNSPLQVLKRMILPVAGTRGCVRWQLPRDPASWPQVRPTEPPSRPRRCAD